MGLWAWTLWTVAALADGGSFQRACGVPRPDVELCLLWNHKVEQGSLEFLFHGKDRDEVAVTRQRGERSGIDWYVGTGTVRGSRAHFWLRVDDSGGLLPVSPRPPRTAALFFRTSANQRWEAYPSSTQFLFSDVKGAR